MKTQDTKSLAKESKYERLYMELRDDYKNYIADCGELKQLHTSEVSELKAEISKERHMRLDSEKRCSLIEENHIALQVKSQDQLQQKDYYIKDLQKQIDEMQVSNARSIEGSFIKQALETKITQLKAQLTSVQSENKTLSQRYEELAKSSMSSRAQLTGRITALTTENASLKAGMKSRENSELKSPDKPKVTATGTVSTSTKYIPLTRRLNKVDPTPYPPKQKVTFSGSIQTERKIQTNTCYATT